MFEQDSFFTLSGVGQLGLALLSCVFFLILLALNRKLARRRPLAVRIAVAALVFWAFVWLSPQVYYTYYLMIFDGLPVQVVIHQPPRLRTLAEILTFTHSHSLSSLGQTLLGWVLLISAFLPSPQRSELTGV